MIYTLSQWEAEDLEHTLNSQKTHCASSSQASNGMSFVSVEEKNEYAITIKTVFKSYLENYSNSSIVFVVSWVVHVLRYYIIHRGGFGLIRDKVTLSKLQPIKCYCNLLFPLFLFAHAKGNFLISCVNTKKITCFHFNHSCLWVTLLLYQVNLHDSW